MEGCCISEYFRVILLCLFLYLLFIFLWGNLFKEIVLKVLGCYLFIRYRLGSNFGRLENY